MTLLWIYDMPLVPEAGGTERITHLISEGLRSRGHKTLGILQFRKGSDMMLHESREVTDLGKFLADHQVDIVINQIAYDPWLLETFLRLGGERWRATGGRILSCLHFDPKPASNLNFFMSLRNKTWRVYLNIVKGWLLKPYYDARNEKCIGKTYNWIYDNSDRFITLSKTHFPYFKSVTSRNEYDRLTSINNPLTFQTIAEESIVDSKQKVVLVCSRMDEYQKKISIVLKAWARIQHKEEASGWKLKMVGDGPDLDRYKNLARKLRLRDVEFEGRQKPKKYYEEASIFLMTSIGIEGWGLTLTESLQNGVVPVVMNTCSVYREIIESGANGFLTPAGNLKAFCDKILLLMGHPEELRRMQREALRSASRFSLAPTLDRWEEVIFEP